MHRSSKHLKHPFFKTNDDGGVGYANPSHLDSCLIHSCIILGSSFIPITAVTGLQLSPFLKRNAFLLIEALVFLDRFLVPIDSLLSPLPG